MLCAGHSLSHRFNNFPLQTGAPTLTYQLYLHIIVHMPCIHGIIRDIRLGFHDNGNSAAFFTKRRSRVPIAKITHAQQEQALLSDFPLRVAF